MKPPPVRLLEHDRAPDFSPRATRVPAPLGLTDASPGGPARLVILGPPGTGKTEATVEWFARPALAASGFDASRVLVCSFTRAAAGVARERLAATAPRRLTADDLQPCARTIHAEALSLVRSVRDVKLRGGRELPDARLEHVDVGRDRRAQALRVWDLARGLRQRNDLRGAFALAAPVGLTVAEVQAEIERYELAKAKANEIDFTDLLEIALTLPCPERDLVVVDEAQDSSPLQWALFERWGSAARKFVLVGDPDQAVHRWCGAWPERLVELARAEAWEVRRLAQSHRVPRAHHRIAVPVIRVVRDRLDAPYTPAGREGTVTIASRDEALERLERAAAEGTTTLVLARSGAILHRFARPLAERGVPFAHERGYSPLTPLPRLAAARGLVALRGHLPAAPADLRELVTALPANFFAHSTRRVVVRALQRAQDTLVTPQVLNSMGLCPDELLEGDLAGALALLELDRRASMQRRLVQDLARLVEVRGPGILTSSPSVTLTTAHGAKGREAPLVVVDLEAPPLVRRNMADRGDDHERQLLYVALTRSCEELALVRHRRRDLGHQLGLRCPA